jgi:hypothetical protein
LTIVPAQQQTSSIPIVMMGALDPNNSAKSVRHKTATSVISAWITWSLDCEVSAPAVLEEGPRGCVDQDLLDQVVIAVRRALGDFSCLTSAGRPGLKTGCWMSPRRLRWPSRCRHTKGHSARRAIG